MHRELLKLIGGFAKSYGTGTIDFYIDNFILRIVLHFMKLYIISLGNKGAKSSRTSKRGSSEDIPLTEQAVRSNEDTLPRENGDAADGDAPDGEPTRKKSSRKEKSVLQAKLTKLAVQIGYAGEIT